MNATAVLDHHVVPVCVHWLRRGRPDMTERLAKS
jgi:hypothetical protein